MSHVQHATTVADGPNPSQGGRGALIEPFHGIRRSRSAGAPVRKGTSAAGGAGHQELHISG